jgi:hypothetical protein
MLYLFLINNFGTVALDLSAETRLDLKIKCPLLSLLFMKNTNVWAKLNEAAQYEIS